MHQIVDMGLHELPFIASDAFHILLSVTVDTVRQLFRTQELNYSSCQFHIPALNIGHSLGCTFDDKTNTNGLPLNRRDLKV